ncbi:MAG: hypothetical protein FJ271_15685 [Planctomycetes bacterium]|nr:hypothetical protein [Planctomycetota bacterium]
MYTPVFGRPATGLLVSASSASDLSTPPVSPSSVLPLPAAVPATPPCRARCASSFLSTYWSVFAGCGLALLVVVTGLALAINYLERAPGEETVAASAPIIAPSPSAAAPVPLQAPRNVPVPAIVKIVDLKVSPPPAPASAAPTSPVNKGDEPPAPKLPDFLLDEAGIGIDVAKDGPKVGKALPEEPPGALPRCETYGTAINFVRSPLQAAKFAQTEDKLVFTLHVSGNFEDPGFT